MQDHQVLVWPENWEAVQLFLALQADWITPGAMGGSYRLPTTEIEAAMRIKGIKDKQSAWQKLQLMKEHAADALMRKYIERNHAA